MEHLTISNLNIWAILLASLINMVIGFLWYSSPMEPFLEGGIRIIDKH